MQANRSVPWVGVVFASALSIISLAAHSEDGCSKDTDCKGDRICNEARQCVDPKSTASKVKEWVDVANAASQVANSIKDAHSKNTDSSNLSADNSNNPPAAAAEQPAAPPAEKAPAVNQAPAPVNRKIAWTPPPVAAMCVTFLGTCKMRQAIPQGAPCGCATPNGMIAGTGR